MSKIIKFENVDISIKERILLKNIDFYLEKGEFSFVSGKIGIGKTTFMKSIFAEIPIKSGKAIVLKYNLRKIKNKHIPLLRRQIGFIFQDFKFLNDRDIYNNLRFVLLATGWANDEKISERIDEVLQEVQMQHKKQSMPYELSGGEQQRVALARAMLNYPKLILADEPTGNLDEESSIYVTQKLSELSLNGTAVLFVTHNKNLFDLVPNKNVYKIENFSLLKIN
jgi:cell division transport system ATP-binding protein